MEKSEKQVSVSRVPLNAGLGVELPLYQSDATPAEREQKLVWMASQMSVVLDQEKIGTPSKFVRIRCGCGKFSQWRNMYRCLYCGIWYCAECAEVHFGKRRAQ